MSNALTATALLAAVLAAACSSGDSAGPPPPSATAPALTETTPASTTTTTTAPAPRPRPPAPLVDVQELEPSIVVALNKLTANNVTGAPLPGYEANRAFLQPAGAEALARPSRMNGTESSSAAVGEWTELPAANRVGESERVSTVQLNVLSNQRG